MQLKTEQINAHDYVDIPGTTHRQKLYLELESRVRDEIRILEEAQDSNTVDSHHKRLLLRETLHVLARAVVMKDNMDDYIHLAFEPRLFDIDLVDLSNTKLNNINDLIDYKPNIFKDDAFVKRMSIRETLNMARGFSTVLSQLLFLGRKSYYGVYNEWGKTRSLNHFEKNIKEHPSFDMVGYQHSRGTFFYTDIVNRDHLFNPHERTQIGIRPPMEKNGPG